jgi:hypothetical protein
MSDPIEIRIDTETFGMTWFFEGLSSLLRKEAQQGRTKIGELAARAAKVEIRTAQKIATRSTYVAFALLCAFAIKVFA